MAEEGFYGRKWSSKTEFERDLADYSKDTYQVFATLDSRTVSKRDIVAVLGTFPDDCDSVEVNNSAVDRDVEVNAGHSGAVEDNDVNRQTDNECNVIVADTGPDPHNGENGEVNNSRQT